MASIIWTESALNDINNIAKFISKDSENIYIISVHHSARLLENNDNFRNLFDE